MIARWKQVAMMVLTACILTGTVSTETVCATEIYKDSDGSGYAQNSKGFVFSIPATATTQEGTRVCMYGGTKQSVTFPTKCGSYRVTHVGSELSQLIMTKFTKVKLPLGYTTIEKYAFQNQTELYQIVIPESVTSIAKTAFKGCDKKKLTIVTPYGSYAETYAKNNGIHYTNSTALQIQTGGTTMYAGETKTIAVMNNAKTITWKSSKPSVAKVSSKGKVTAKKAGKTTITAKIGTKTYSYTFEVLSRTQKNVLKVIWENYVTADLSDYEKVVAANKWMKANVSSTGTSVSASKAFTQGSVNDTGYAKAYKKILDHYGIKTKVVAGTTHVENTVVIAGKKVIASTIAAASDVDKTYTTTTCAGVALDKSTMNLSVGKTDTFKPLGVTGEITWKSSNKKVAKVNKNGKVTAIGAGIATITMKIAGSTYQCTVRVNE